MKKFHPHSGRVKAGNSKCFDFPAAAASPLSPESHIPLGAMRTRFNAVEKDGEITITSRDGKFKASYYKPAGQPQLILLEQSKTDDYELLADAWKAANDKARELGWID